MGTIVHSELLEDCRNAVAVNLDNLRKILRDNQDTAYGKKYGFSDIKDADAYRRRVPLTDYEDYRKMTVCAAGGEKAEALSAYPLAGWCRTSGTEGGAKCVPLSLQALKQYSDIIERRQNRLLDGQKGGKRLLLSTFRTEPFEKSEESLLCSELHYRYLFEQGVLRPEECLGDRRMLFCRGENDLLYAKARMALLSEDVVLIEGIFLYEILYFFDFLEKHWRELLEESPCGDGRLRLLETEFSRGFKNIAGRIWPRLRLLCGISSRGFFAENEALKRYSGKIPQYFLGYCASECFMGVPLRDDDFQFVLLPGSGFYEFLPFPAGQDCEKTLLPGELKKGNYYEIVVTNYSGFYRYRMGDILCVTDFAGESPVYEFWSRKDHMLNIAGEKITEFQLEAAVSRLRETGMAMRELCFWASLKELPGKYAALLVPEEGGQSAEAARRLDRALAELNPDYADLRSLGHLDAPEVILCTADGYHDFIRSHTPARRHGKPVHILPGIQEGEVFYEKKV